MPQYHTINLDKKYYNHLDQFIQQREEYTSVKDFLKQSANEKRQKLENQETQQLLQILDKILKNSNITKQEVQQMIQDED